MELESLLQQVTSVAGTFGARLIIILFVACFIGEFHITVPYLMETIWLLNGFHVGSGTLSPYGLLVLWLAAIAGRQTGATALFYLVRLGSSPIERFLHAHFGASLSSKMAGNNSWPVRLLRRMRYLSPLSITAGRLFWLRIPLTMALAVERRLKPLWIGVALSGFVWDGIYIMLGIVGGHVVLKPTEMLLYSLVGLTGLYIITFAGRQAMRAFSRRARTT